MPEFTVNTPAGQTVQRKLLRAYGNSGTYDSPKWNVIGKRVEDSSTEMDWSEESKQDILGNTWATMKTPIVSQGFDPCEIDSGDEYQAKLLQLAIIDQDAQALSNQDLLLVHLYLQDGKGNAFAERYPSSMVKPTGLGGEGGGSLTMPIDVTFGGEREKGSARLDGGIVTFTPNTSAVEGE